MGAKARNDMHPSEIDGARGVAGDGVGSAEPPRACGARSRAGGSQSPSLARHAAPLGRRAFLAGLVAALGLVAAGRAFARATTAAGSAPPPLAALLRQRSSAAAVGARYLREHPAERAAALRAPGPRGARALDATARRRALRRESARDFAEGRVVRVDGWILSRTEARLCAAVWLGASR
jgi:hypothetical protein